MRRYLPYISEVEFRQVSSLVVEIVLITPIVCVYHMCVVHLLIEKPDDNFIFSPGGNSFITPYGPKSSIIGGQFGICVSAHC